MFVKAIAHSSFLDFPLQENGDGESHRTITLAYKSFVCSFHLNNCLMVLSPSLCDLMIQNESEERKFLITI